ncbi:hypothetical protein AWN90_09215 [Nocardia terpenica]|uniref:Uncharacterized protein n=1 Tax=Nocardia terpenica TaxID=455432 RepID=A0A164H101_9NOCA|nr:hypothetical protein AWN90_09215 [Nocardia terpenica]
MISSLSIDLIDHLPAREIAVRLGVPRHPDLVVNAASTDSYWLHLRTSDGEAVTWESTWTAADLDGETIVQTANGTFADLVARMTDILGRADRLRIPAQPVHLEISRWALHYQLTNDIQARKAVAS